MAKKRWWSKNEAVLTDKTLSLKNNSTSLLLMLMLCGWYSEGKLLELINMSGVRLLAQGQEMKLKVELFWPVKKGKRSVHNGYASVIYSTGWSPAQDNEANQTDNCKHTHTCTHTHTHRKRGRGSEWGKPTAISHSRWKWTLIATLHLHSGFTFFNWYII